MGRVIRRRDPIRGRSACLRMPLRGVGGRVTGTGRERTVSSLDAVAGLRLSVAVAVVWTDGSPRRALRGVAVSGDGEFVYANAVKDSVLVGRGSFAHVYCATLGATGVCDAGRPRSSRLLTQGLGIVGALDLCHQFVGHLPVFFHGMERGEEWRGNPVDGAGISHCGIDGVHVGLAVRVWWRGRHGSRVKWWWSGRSIMLLEVFSGGLRGELGRRGRASGLEGEIGRGWTLLWLAGIGSVEDLHD